MPRVLRSRLVRLSDDTPSPQPLESQVSRDNRTSVHYTEVWVDSLKRRRSGRGSDMPSYLRSSPPGATELSSSSRPLPSARYPLEPKSDWVHESTEFDERTRRYPLRDRVQNIRPMRAPTEDVEREVGKETPSEPESASQYQAPSSSPQRDQFTCPPLTLSSGSEIDLDSDSSLTSNWRSYSLSHSGSVSLSESISRKWQSSGPSPLSQQSLSTFSPSAISPGSEIEHFDSSSTLNLRSSASQLGSLSFLDSFSRTSQLSTRSPSLPAPNLPRDISMASETIAACDMMPLEDLSIPRLPLRSCLRPIMTQAVPRVEASNEHESPDKNAVEHDSPSERNRKRVRLCLPHEERMKQEHQIEQMIMHRLEADKLQFPDRWDLTHELFCERDSERSEFYDRARWEAEIELCGHLGIPNLKVQIFSAEEEPLEDPRLSENERTTLDYELEAQLGTEQQDIIDGTIDNPLAIYISDDEMESGLQIEPDVASGPGLRSSIRIASGLVGGYHIARSGNPVNRGMLTSITTGISMNSRDRLTEPAGYENQNPRPVHEQRRYSNRKETPNTRMRRQDGELIRGLGSEQARQRSKNSGPQKGVLRGNKS